MTPAPSHLVNCVALTNGTDDKTFEADVRCLCGFKIFELYFTGHTHEYEGQPIPCTAEIDGNFFFLVKAKCASCQKEHLLFDKDFHGWDGFVCHEPEQASLPRPSLTPWTCLSCGSGEHKASIRIQTEGKENFIEQTNGEFDAERWSDGFEWFSMSIECASCGMKTPEWISYETM